ncbi:hypothetical protein MXD81_14670, partial [Microbacteriaceae bacterium K1510]|nr:hypothetical protein [Microbacteriaceae bacterium K1510]
QEHCNKHDEKEELHQSHLASNRIHSELNPGPRAVIKPRSPDFQGCSRLFSRTNKTVAEDILPY